jgi:hypothetical protein
VAVAVAFLAAFWHVGHIATLEKYAGLITNLDPARDNIFVTVWRVRVIR